MTVTAPAALRRAALLLAGAAMGVLGACVRTPPAERPPAAPRPTTAPAGRGEAPARRGGGFGYAPGTYRYIVMSEASVGLQRDADQRTGAAGVPLVDTVTTTAHLTYRVAGMGDVRRVAGTVDSFSVASTGLVPNVAQALARPLPFQATLAGARLPTEFRGTAADTACAAPDAALLVLARDLLVPAPPALTPGAQWADTVTTTLCRAGIAVTTYSLNRYRALGATLHEGADAMRVARTTEIALSGEGRPRGQTVTVVGTGRGTGELFIDVGGGRFLGGTGQSTIELTVSNGAQSRRFVQAARQRVELEN